ncbi:hypothetical protein [environmental halophage 1 AAJ-2005]|nr:hypothetical protein [environmental halophage 1 AAJ-2005]
MTDNRTQLVCPDCGSTRFGWTITQVQFGEMVQYQGGSRKGIGNKMGPITDGHDEVVTCSGCNRDQDKDDLKLLTDSGDNTE